MATLLPLSFREAEGDEESAVSWRRHSLVTWTLLGYPGLRYKQSQRRRTGKSALHNLGLALGFTLRIQLLEEINVRTMRTRVVPALIIILGGLLLAGCPPRVSIAKLNRDPGRYAGREVAIGGRVVDSYGAFGRGVFQVDDGTGTIWVVAGQYGIPAAGAKLAVTGHVEQGFSLGGRNFATILRETERRH